jgi:hypothetical protein
LDIDSLLFLIDRKPFFQQVSARGGVGPRRGFIGPAALEDGYMSFKGKVRFNFITDLQSNYLNAGLMKPRRGFTPTAGGENPCGLASSQCGNGLLDFFLNEPPDLIETILRQRLKPEDEYRLSV